MLTIAICDDDAVILQHLRELTVSYLPDATPYQIYDFSSSASLTAAIEAGLSPDIAFLDIQLEDANGIQLSKSLFPKGNSTQVIFVSGYIEYCSSVYETEHIYFLLKPVQEADFQRALEKAILCLETLPEKYLMIQTKTKIQRISFSSIRYIESQARKIVICCRNETVEYYSTLGSLLSQLPRNFVHCHKSFCVNMDFVAQMEPNQFLMDEQDTVPISQAKKTVTRQKFLEYLSRHI